MLVGNGWIVPWSMRESRYLLNTEIAGKPLNREVTHDLYLRDGRRILSVAQSFPHRGEIQGLVILDLDLHFRPERRLEAASGVHAGGGRWQLQQVTVRSFDPDTQELLDFSRQAEMPLDLGRTPAELSEAWTEPAELSLPQLADVGERLRRDGQDPRRYLGELHFRAAQSVMPLIMVLLGVPFALQRGRQATLGVGVALCLGVFVVYLMLQAVGMALGTAGLLPLPLAAWAANLLLLLVGAWLFMTLDD